LFAAMLASVRHVLIAGSAVAVVTALLMLPLTLFKNGFNIEPALADWPYIVAMPALAGLAATVSLGVFAWRSRQSVQALARRLTAARHNPSRANAVNGAVAKEPSRNGLAPLVDECEALCTSYRQALADRIKQREVLEVLRARLADFEGIGDGEGPDARATTPSTSASGRHLVGRLTTNLRWLNATPALQKLLGYSAEELNGRAFLDLVSAKNADALTRVFHDCLASGQVTNNIVRFLARRRRGDGEGRTRTVTEYRYVRMDVMTRRNSDGQPVHFRCYFEDITERVKGEKKLSKRTDELHQAHNQLKRITQDLERLKESYRDLYHNAPIMFFTLDAEARFVACNDTMVQLLGYRREELHEQPFSRVLTNEDAAAWKRSRQPGANGSRPPHALMVDCEIVMQWVKADGKVIDVWIRSIPQTEEDGKLVRSRSAAHDVTQRNRLANELSRRRDELEQANAELLIINKELDDFTSVVAHDLKEPLRTLEAYSKLLAEDYSTQLGADGFECIRYMLTASRRLSKLIDGVLNLSRAGKMATTPRVFHLNEAVALVRRDLGDMLLRKNATLNVEGSLPTVVGDLERVTQILTNLVSNGLKFQLPSQPPVVIVGEANRTDKPGFVTIFVRDNGIGIEPKFHKELFGMFRRLDRKNEYEGHGAGLAICKKIVLAHAGTIWVESALGAGSTFFFTLPRSPQSAAALLPMPNGGSENQADAPPLPARSANLLLVEDMPEMGLIVQRFARKAGHELCWVKTAEEAWDHLQGNRPDLVLLDIHLPGMNGIELCRRLRTQQRQTTLPIALFSQGALPEDITAGLSAGANYVLSKELLCQPEAWRQRLAEILHSSKSVADTTP
jgi:PAS domain S-box-containing protein